MCSRTGRSCWAVRGSQRALEVKGTALGGRGQGRHGSLWDRDGVTNGNWVWPSERYRWALGWRMAKVSRGSEVVQAPCAEAAPPLLASEASSPLLLQPPLRSADGRPPASFWRQRGLWRHLYVPTLAAHNWVLSHDLEVRAPGWAPGWLVLCFMPRLVLCHSGEGSVIAEVRPAGPGVTPPLCNKR